MFRKALSIVAAIVLFPMLATAGGQDVYTKTDAFSGKTNVFMNGFGLGTFADKTHLGGLASLSLGAGTTDDGRIMFVIVSAASNWQFVSGAGAQVRVLADGHPIDLGFFKEAGGHVETVGGVSCIEQLGGYVDRATLLEMANAKELAIEVGVYQHAIKGKEIARLKKFAEALPAVK